MRRLTPCRTVLGLTATLCTLGQSCVPSPPSGEAAYRNAPAYITAVHYLAPPAVGLERVYQPTSAFVINPDGSAAQAVGFRLTVATRAPGFLQIRLTNRLTGITQNLRRIDTPISGITSDEGAPRPADSATRELLAAGESVFWLEETAGSETAIEHRVAVLVPDSARGPLAGLDVYTATASDGTPINIDHIELADGFFYLAVLGDSVAWGNGLLDQDKYPARIAALIETATQRRVIRQTLALSGARIVPDPTDGICGISCYRESPAVSTSITAQVDLVEHPELVELVLMDGCINDVSIATIIDPDTTQDELITGSTRFCRDEMAGLIRNVRDRMPQAPIIVTGYFPIISLASDLMGLLAWYQSEDVETSEDLSKFVEGASANSITFADSSRADLAAAVANASAALPPGPPIVFVDPGFTTDNAVFTPDSWLWGVTADRTRAGILASQLTLFPADPQFPSRLPACLRSSGAELSLGCVFASVGHPNVRGAQAYADAIADALRNIGILPQASRP